MMNSDASIQSRPGALPGTAGGAGSARPPAAVLWRIAWIAAAFCLLVGGYMFQQHLLATERDPWKSPQLIALKEKLRASPTDESLKAEIRRLDLEFRQRYQHRLALDAAGGWLLIAGGVVWVLTARPVFAGRVPPWLPKPRTDTANESRRQHTRARRAVTAVGALVGSGLLALAWAASSPLPKSAPGPGGLAAGTDSSRTNVPAPTMAEFEQNWPQFRGMQGGWAMHESGFDLRSVSVIWKEPIPAPGYNSPIVWSNRVFVSGGDVRQREIFCFDSDDGKLLWRRSVEVASGAPAAPLDVPDATGWAAPTMATDGRLAFALFVNGDLAAVNFNGDPVWTKQIGVPQNSFGHASSLAIAPGKLIVQLDQDEDALGGSKLLAFDTGTGRKLWERTKPTHSSWSSPIIIQAAGKGQIITLALPWAMSHALADGTELWRAEVLQGEITPSPVFAGGRLVVASPGDRLLALQPDGAGNVTESRMLWEAQKQVPDVTSPVSDGEWVYTVTSFGWVTCRALGNGAESWNHELKMEVQASPTIAGNQLLVLGTAGELVALATGREFQELSRTNFADRFHASPAFGDGRMFLRGATNLWCLGRK